MILFVATAIIVGLLVVRFNTKTYALVRNIQRVAEREGTAWTFYGSPRRRFLFLLCPANLINSSDSVALKASKEALLDHRKRLWRTLFIAWGIMIVGFVLSAGVPLGYALLTQNWHAQ